MARERAALHRPDGIARNASTSTGPDAGDTTPAAINPESRSLSDFLYNPCNTATGLLWSVTNNGSPFRTCLSRADKLAFKSVILVDLI